jgi:hypothetical protein
MYCETCRESVRTKTLDSRTPKGGFYIRRVRECLNCGERFTTREVKTERVLDANQFCGVAYAALTTALRGYMVEDEGGDPEGYTNRGG